MENKLKNIIVSNGFKNMELAIFNENEIIVNRHNYLFARFYFNQVSKQWYLDKDFCEVRNIEREILSHLFLKELNNAKDR